MAEGGRRCPLEDHANSHASSNDVTRAHLVGHLRVCQERVCERLTNYRGGWDRRGEPRSHVCRGPAPEDVHRERPLRGGKPSSSGNADDGT